MTTEQTAFTVQQLRAHPTVGTILEGLSRADIEQALLGTLLARGQLVAKTAGIITAEDFADPMHGAVFQAIADRVSRGEAVDPRLLNDVAQRFSGEFEDQQAAQRYLADLLSAAGLPSNVRGYADALAEASKRRRLVDASLQAIAEAAETDQPFGDVASAAITAAERLLESRRVRTRAQVLADMVAQMERPAAIYPTGLACLDKAMGGGMHAGRMYCFAGKGKSGKSLLAGTISHALNRAGVKHAYFAFEMGAVQIEHRQVARDLNTHSMALLGKVSDRVLADAGRYTALVQANGLDNVLYVDMPGGSFAELRAEVMAARHQHGATGIIVDYWQLVKGRDARTSEEEHLRMVAEWLAAAVARLGIWCLVLAQLTDDGEATAVSRTAMNRNADQVYFIRSDPDGLDRWFEMKFSRYTPASDVGSKQEPAVKLVYPGPHFMDLTSTPERQAQREMGE